MATQTDAQTLTTPAFVGTLGLKPDVFIAQLVNFLIILFVLWRWAYKPIVAMLEKREQRIQEGMDNADKIEKRLAAVEQEHAAALKEAREEAAAFLQQSQKSAEEKREQVLEKAKEEVAKLVDDARKNIATERAEATAALKKDIAALVATSVELLLQEKIDAHTDMALMERTVKKVQKK